MKITILCVGKIKEKFYRDAVAEYEKRLSRYCRFEVTEVADEKTPDHASDTETRQIKDKEGERLLRQIKDGTYLIALAIQGEKLDSVAFSEKIASFLIFLMMSVRFTIKKANSVVSLLHRYRFL